MSVAPARSARRGHRVSIGVVGGAWLVVRRLRFDPVPALTMFLLVAATCFLFAALPRLFHRYADDGLRDAVAHASLVERSVRASEPSRLAPGTVTDPLANVVRDAARTQQQLPAPLRELIVGRTFLVSSPRYSTERALPGLARYLTLRLQSGVRPRIRLVAGRLPGTSAVRIRTVDRRIPELPLSKTVPLLEIALSTTTAQKLRLHVGDREVLLPDLADVSKQQVPRHDEQPLAVKVTGLFVVDDPHSAFWFGDPTLASPEVQVTQSLDTTLVFGQALASPEAYATVLEATRPFRLSYEYRYFLDPARVDAGRLQTLTEAAARLDARYAGAGPLETRVETGLSSVLARYRSTRSQAATLLAVGAIGILACAIACIGLLGALSYERRRADAAASRARGASPQSVLVTQALEAVLVVVPAGLVGWGLAVSTIDGRSSALSGWLVLAVVGAAVLLLVAAIAGVARRPLGPAGREDVVLGRPSARRLAVEGSIAVAAAVGVYLLRRRGLGASSPTSTTALDPYLAAVPVLLGLSCGIVALRLYPLVLGALARLARRGRGLALHLGLSRAARQRDIAAAPLLVLLLALAIASFSAVMLSSLGAGQDRTGWRTVGADARIDAPGGERLPARLVSRLASLGDVARAHVRDVELAVGNESTLLIALDIPAWEDVVRDTPAATGSLRGLRRPPTLFPGAVPALVSADWPVAGSFQVDFPRRTVTVLDVGQGRTPPPISDGAAFALVPLSALERVAGPQGANRLYARGVSERAVREAVRETAPGAEIRTRGGVVRSLRSPPLADGVFRGFGATIVVAALYAAVAIALMALVAARTRSRDLALVRTMGGAEREAHLLAAVELTPFLLLALVLGIGLGVAIPYLIAPGLDLAFFTGSGSGSDPIVVPWASLALLAAGLLVLVGALALLVGIRTRRANLDRVLRIGER